MMVLPTTAYSSWSARLKSGTVYDERNGVDWDHLVRSGDVREIAELTLHCPTGQTRTLDISEPGTAFQLKRASVMNGVHMRSAHIIGRIDDLNTGMCTAHIWDTFTGLVEEFHTCFDHFEAWRFGIEAPGELSRTAQGMSERL